MTSNVTKAREVGKPKEAWEMTFEEFMRCVEVRHEDKSEWYHVFCNGTIYDSLRFSRNWGRDRVSLLFRDNQDKYFKELYGNIIEQALLDGKPIPAEILAYNIATKLKSSFQKIAKNRATRLNNLKNLQNQR